MDLHINIYKKNNIFYSLTQITNETVMHIESTDLFLCLNSTYMNLKKIGINERYVINKDLLYVSLYNEEMDNINIIPYKDIYNIVF